MSRHRELAQMMRAAAGPPPDPPLILYPCQVDTGATILNSGTGGSDYDVNITSSGQHSYGIMPNGETGIIQLAGNTFHASTANVDIDISAGFSICACMRVAHYVDTANVLTYGETASSFAGIRTTATPALQGLVRNSSSSAFGVITFSTSLTTTRHCAYTYNPSVGATLYINGVQQDTAGTGPSDAMLSGEPLRIGFAPEAGGRRFVGSYNDLRFYTRALSPAEVAALSAAHNV